MTIVAAEITAVGGKKINQLNMAHKRKGQLTVTSEWAKHLRKFWRRQFWKGERKAGKILIKQER